MRAHIRQPTPLRHAAVTIVRSSWVIFSMIRLTVECEAISETLPRSKYSRRIWISLTWRKHSSVFAQTSRQA